MGGTIACCRAVIARLTIGQRRLALYLRDLIGSRIIRLMSGGIVGYGRAAIGLWSVLRLRRLLGESRRVVGGLSHGGRQRLRLVLVASQRRCIHGGAMGW